MSRKKRKARKKPKKRDSSKYQKHNTRKAWFDWAKAIGIGVIGSVMAFYLIKYFMEPMKNDVFSYYYVLTTVPVTESNEIDKKITQTRDMFSIIVMTHKTINIDHIKIHNIHKMIGVSFYCSQNDVNNVIYEKINTDYNSNIGTLVLSKIPTFPAESKFIINVLGVIDRNRSNPVIVLENNNKIWPIESKLVAESSLFLAEYWKLVLTLNILIILSIYYFLKTRENQRPH